VNILLQRKSIHHDRHEPMVDPTDLATLSIIGSLSFDKDRGLVESPWTGIHLDPKGRHCPAVENIRCGNDQPNMGIHRKGHPVVDFQQPKVSGF
jgi:hypothetical protein